MGVIVLVNIYLVWGNFKSFTIEYRELSHTHFIFNVREDLT